MALENGTSTNSADAMDGAGGRQPEEKGEHKCFSLQKFKLYETRSKFYIIGRDKSSTRWRVLKIDRLECSELIIDEDPVTYSPRECCDLLQRIDEGNRATGGLILVTKCYGIVGWDGGRIGLDNLLETPGQYVKADMTPKMRRSIS